MAIYSPIRDIAAATIAFLSTGFAIEPCTIKADVTGDNMYDAIKITEDAVYVVDRMLCCTKKRFPVVSSRDDIYDVKVGDFSRSHRGNEVAIVFGTQTPNTTVVYAFQKGAFSRISNDIPGAIRFCDNVPCFDGQYLPDCDSIALPWPLYEDEKFMKPTTLSATVDSFLQIRQDEVFTDTLIIPPEHCMLVVVWSQQRNIKTTLSDIGGSIIAEKSYDRTALVRLLHSSLYDHIIVRVYNSQSDQIRYINHLYSP
jgi:hypothetical protein